MVEGSRLGKLNTGSLGFTSIYTNTINIYVKSITSMKKFDGKYTKHTSLSRSGFGICKEKPLY